jgi:hypothetical protein
MAGVPATALPGQAPQTSPPELDDHGAFEIFADGKSLGTEKIDIRAHADQIEAQGSMDLEVEQDGKKIEVRTSSTLLLDSQFNPLSYTWNRKGPQSAEVSVNFRAHPAQEHRKVNGQDNRQDFKLEKNVVVLDDNAIDQYQLVVDRYDQAKGGTQTFAAFIPQEAVPGQITLSFTGVDSPTVNGEQRTLRHFLLTADLAKIDLWADDQGHLQVVSAPDAHFQAVRKK